MLCMYGLVYCGRLYVLVVPVCIGVAHVCNSVVRLCISAVHVCISVVHVCIVAGCKYAE